MFNFFKGKRKEKKDQLPSLSDLNNQPLQEGDLVLSLRYDLGKCRLIVQNESYAYESLDSGETVSWVKMIDAATENQKVKKIIPGQEGEGEDKQESKPEENEMVKDQ